MCVCTCKGVAIHDVFLTQYLKNSIESPEVSHLDITVVYYMYILHTTWLMGRMIFCDWKRWKSEKWKAKKVHGCASSTTMTYQTLFLPIFRFRSASASVGHITTFLRQITFVGSFSVDDTIVGWFGFNFTAAVHARMAFHHLFQLQ